MKKKFWRYFFIAFIFGMAIPIVQATEWTLQMCIDSTLHHNHRLRAAQEQIKSATASFNEARAMRYGSFDLSSSYQHSTEVQELKLPITIPGIKISPVKFGDGDVYDLAASVKVPLYTGGALRNKMVAEWHGMKATENDRQNELVQVVAEVKRAFYQAVSTKNALKLAKKNFARASRHVTETSDGVSVGSLPREALIQARAYEVHATSSVTTATADAEAAMINLRGLAQLYRDDTINSEGLLTKIPPNNTSDASSSETIAPRVLNTHPIYNGFMQRIEQAKYVERATRANWLPSVSAQGVYHYAKPGVSPIDNEWMNYATLGVQLTWTGFDWGARDAKIEKSKANRKAIAEKMSDVERTLRDAIQVTDLRLKSSEQNIESMKQRFELLSERQRMVEDRWKQGQATQSEWIDATDDAYTAENNVINAVLRWKFAETDFEAAQGIAGTATNLESEKK